MTAAPTEPEAASQDASVEGMEASTVKTLVHVLAGKLPWKLLARPWADR